MLKTIFRIYYTSLVPEKKLQIQQKNACHLISDTLLHVKITYRLTFLLICVKNLIV
jgi:hypothetical protein